MSKKAKNCSEQLISNTQTSKGAKSNAVLKELLCRKCGTHMCGCVPWSGMSSQRSSISFTPPLATSPSTDALTCSAAALCSLWFELRSLWVAGSDRVVRDTSSVGNLRGRMPHNPQDREPSMSSPLSQGNRSSGTEGRGIPGGGRGRRRALCGSPAIWRVYVCVESGSE